MTDNLPAIQRWALIPTAQEAPEALGEEGFERLVAAIEAREVGALLWSYEAEALERVAAVHAATGVPICPIVPNMATYARDTRDKGFVGAALARLLALPVCDIARVALGAIPAARDVLTKDFATGVCILAEMELARFRRFDPVAAFLNNQIGDLALAFDHARLFERFAHLSRGRYGFEAGFITYNFGHLAPRLSQWGIAPGRLVAPFNPKGYLMYPDRAACEGAAAVFAPLLVASHPDAGQTVDAAASDRYLSGLNIGRSIAPWDSRGEAAG